MYKSKKASSAVYLASTVAAVLDRVAWPLGNSGSGTVGQKGDHPSTGALFASPALHSWPALAQPGAAQQAEPCLVQIWGCESLGTLQLIQRVNDCALAPAWHMDHSQLRACWRLEEACSSQVMRFGKPEKQEQPHQASLCCS